MTQVTLTSNAAAVAITIRDFSSTIKKNKRKVLEAAAKRLQTAAKVYPPKPANSTYVRTGKLKRSWGIIPYARGSTGIRSTLIYAPYVQKKTAQAWMHRGRWQTDEDIARSEVKKLQKKLDAAILDGIK